MAAMLLDFLLNGRNNSYGYFSKHKINDRIFLLSKVNLTSEPLNPWREALPIRIGAGSTEQETPLLDHQCQRHRSHAPKLNGVERLRRLLRTDH